MNSREKYNKRTGFAQILDEAVSSCPEREAIVYGSTRISYGELDRLINKTANMLLSDGIGKGTPVALISRNTPEFLIAEFALYRIGAVPVKINWRLTPAEMEDLLDVNGVTNAFMRAEKKQWGEELVAHYHSKFRFFPLACHEGEPSLIDFVSSYSDSRAEAELDDGDVSCRLHTSGTTGRAKGVVYTHGAMLDEIETVRGMYGYEPGQRYQFIAQLFHSAAIGAHLCLATGGTLVLMSRFEVGEYIESLIKERITAISVVPTVLKWILDETEKQGYDLSNISVVRYSTCPIPPALLERAIKLMQCRFYQSYGMTEMGSIVTTLQPGDHTDGVPGHLTSVGRPIPGAKVRVVRPDGSDCDCGEIGEIIVQGPGHMLCYYQLPELTEKVFSDGWYHTHDMGSLAEDGYLSISGRADDMIISGGENIYPSEITNVIMQLTDDVRECAVYGVPDETWGERVKASVVLVRGSSMTSDGIRAYCRANMPSFRVPKEIEILDELPKNPSGKVLISELKARSQS